MKIVNSKLLLICLLLTFGFVVNGLCQNNPKPYKITDSYFDSTLQKDEAKVEFIFINQQNKPLNIPVRLFYNSVLNTAPADDNGAIQLKIKPGKYKFSFFYNKRQDLYYIEQDDYVITTDSILLKPSEQVIIIVNLGDVKEQGNGPIVKKPQIYFYPKKTTVVNVKLDFKGTLSFTYPKYENGWNFTSEPDGKLYIADKEYNYLFWDGIADVASTNGINYNEGFIVNKDNLISFFEEKLTQMGLNSREQQDFITFWGPLMSVNENNYIHFMFNESCNQFAALNISPIPDHLFRVYMIWSKVNQQQLDGLKNQTIPAFNRQGFSVVEWGGMEMSKFEKNNLSAK